MGYLIWKSSTIGSLSRLFMGTSHLFALDLFAFAKNADIDISHYFWYNNSSVRPCRVRIYSISTCCRQFSALAQLETHPSEALVKLRLEQPKLLWPPRRPSRITIIRLKLRAPALRQDIHQRRQTLFGQGGRGLLDKHGG